MDISFMYQHLEVEYLLFILPQIYYCMFLSKDTVQKQKSQEFIDLLVNLSLLTTI